MLYAMFSNSQFRHTAGGIDALVALASASDTDARHEALMALAVLENSTVFEYASNALTERVGKKDLVASLRAVVHETPSKPAHSN